MAVSSHHYSSGRPPSACPHCGASVVVRYSANGTHGLCGGCGWHWRGYDAALDVVADVFYGNVDPALAEPEPELPYEFTTEPVMAWRAWEVVDFELHGGATEPRLTSANGWSGGFWPARVRAEAICSNMPHEAPWPDCECGFWALKTREHAQAAARNYLGLRQAAVGEVALWGRVLECEQGWRGRYAYPQRLIVFDEAHLELERIYGIPVELLEPDLGANLTIDEVHAMQKAAAATWPALRKMNQAFVGLGRATSKTAKLFSLTTASLWPSDLVAPPKPFWLPHGAFTAGLMVVNEPGPHRPEAWYGHVFAWIREGEGYLLRERRDPKPEPLLPDLSKQWIFDPAEGWSPDPPRARISYDFAADVISIDAADVTWPATEEIPAGAFYAASQEALVDAWLADVYRRLGLDV